MVCITSCRALAEMLARLSSLVPRPILQAIRAGVSMGLGPRLEALLVAR